MNIVGDRLNNVRVGKRLSKERNARGISIEQLSLDTGIELSLLLEYEAGTKKMYVVDGIAIAKNWDIDPFFFGIETALPKTMPKTFFELLRGKQKPSYNQILNLWERTMTRAFKKRSKSETTSAFQIQLFQPQLMKDESPFMFLRIIMILAIIYGLAYLTTDITIANLSLSMMVPFSMMWCLYERHLPRTISGIDLVGYFFFGGLAAIFTVLIIRNFIGYPDIVFVQDLLTGLVEESSKILIVLFLVRKRRLENVLSGLLVGFAVGAGFSVFETARYGIDHLLEYLDFGSMQYLVSLRSMFSLIGAGHHFWTGMLTGVLVALSRTGYLKLTDLIKPIFLIWFVIIALIHALFNFGSNFPYVPHVIAVGSLFLFVSMWIKAMEDYKRDSVSPIESQGICESIDAPKDFDPTIDQSTTEIAS